MSLPFKAGDRIRYHNQTGPSADGVVVQDSGMGPCQVLVKLDSAAYTSWAYSGYLEKLPPLENVSQWNSSFTLTGMPDSASIKFRRDPNMRKWRSKVFKKAAEENAKEIDRLHGVATGFRHELSELDSALADHEKRLIELKAELAKAKVARAEAMLENVNLREQIANAQRALEHKS